MILAQLTCLWRFPETPSLCKSNIFTVLSNFFRKLDSCFISSRDSVRATRWGAEGAAFCALLKHYVCKRHTPWTSSSAQVITSAQSPASDVSLLPDPSKCSINSGSEAHESAGFEHYSEVRLTETSRRISHSHFGGESHTEVLARSSRSEGRQFAKQQSQRSHRIIVPNSGR